MQHLFVDPAWGFEEAVTAAWERYSGGVMGMGYRTTVLRTWGNVVGRDRAVAGVTRFIEDAGGVKRAAELLGMAASTLRRLRQYFEGLPTPEGFPLSQRESVSDAIDRALQSGEGHSVEFKEAMPPQARDLAKEVAAFATSDGGMILLGVANDGRIVGFTGPTERVEGVAQLVDPTPRVRVETHERAGRSLCVIVVASGDHPVYYVEHRPYLRDGSLSRPAKPDEVIRLVQSSDSRTKESPEQEVNDAIRESEERSYDIGGTNRSAREVLERVGSQLLKGRDAFGFRADIAHAFGVSPSSCVDERPVLHDWMLSGIVDTPQRIHPPRPSGPQSGTERPAEPYDRYTLSALGKSVLRALGRRKPRAGQ